MLFVNLVRLGGATKRSPNGKSNNDIVLIKKYVSKCLEISLQGHKNIAVEAPCEKLPLKQVKNMSLVRWNFF